MAGLLTRVVLMVPPGQISHGQRFHINQMIMPSRAGTVGSEQLPQPLLVEADDSPSQVLVPSQLLELPGEHSRICRRLAHALVVPTDLESHGIGSAQVDGKPPNLLVQDRLSPP